MFPGIFCSILFPRPVFFGVANQTSEADGAGDGGEGGLKPLARMARILLLDRKFKTPGVQPFGLAWRITASAADLFGLDDG